MPYITLLLLTILGLHFRYQLEPSVQVIRLRDQRVMWFPGYPGVPKLPLVQRRRASPSSLNPVASFTPEDEEQEEESEEDP